VKYFNTLEQHPAVLPVCHLLNLSHDVEESQRNGLIRAPCAGAGIALDSIRSGNQHSTAFKQNAT
jgi:hypothetical protein